MNETATYFLESAVPSWLASDSGYLAALKATLVSRMTLQGWEVVHGPFVVDDTARSDAPVPLGIVLLRAWCDVAEFDVEVPVYAGIGNVSKHAELNHEQYEDV